MTGTQTAISNLGGRWLMQRGFDCTVGVGRESSWCISRSLAALSDAANSSLPLSTSDVATAAITGITAEVIA